MTSADFCLDSILLESNNTLNNTTRWYIVVYWYQYFINKCVIIPCSVISPWIQLMSMIKL